MQFNKAILTDALSSFRSPFLTLPAERSLQKTLLRKTWFRFSTISAGLYRVVNYKILQMSGAYQGLLPQWYTSKMNLSLDLQSSPFVFERNKLVREVTVQLKATMTLITMSQLAVAAEAGMKTSDIYSSGFFEFPPLTPTHPKTDSGCLSHLTECAIC